MTQSVATHGSGSREVAEALVHSASEAREPDVALRALGLFVSVAESLSDNADLARAAASVVIESPRLAVLEVLNEASWIRPVLWEMTAQVLSAGRSSWLDGLIERDDPAAAAGGIAALFSSEAAQVKDEVGRYALEAIADDRLSAEHVVASEPTDLRDALAVEARDRALAARSELTRLRALMSLGDQAAAAELVSLIEPLVERAVERNVGNERLQADYSSVLVALKPSLEEPAPTRDGLDVSEIEALNDQLGPIVRLELDGAELRAHLDPDADARSLVRPVALIDHRAGRERRPCNDFNSTHSSR